MDLRDALTKLYLLACGQFLLLGPDLRVSNQDVNSKHDGLGEGQCIYYVCRGKRQHVVSILKHKEITCNAENRFMNVIERKENN